MVSEQGSVSGFILKHYRNIKFSIFLYIKHRLFKLIYISINHEIKEREEILEFQRLHYLETHMTITFLSPQNYLYYFYKYIVTYAIRPLYNLISKIEDLLDENL